MEDLRTADHPAALRPPHRLGRRPHASLLAPLDPPAPTAPVVLSTRRSGAVLEVGEDCGFTGTTLVAADRITIGYRVLVGGNASIVDFDFHPLTPEGRAEAINAGAAAHILIGDDVFVGTGALVLKSVTIGDGAVVGAVSVVTQDVPPWTVVGGILRR